MRREFNLMILLLILLLFVSDTLLHKCICEAKMRPIISVKISLENEPNIGGIAILKLSVVAPKNLDLERVNIGCYIPLELELVSDIKFEISNNITEETREKWGNLFMFYTGPMKKSEKKEFILKVRIPDEKRYCISVYGGDEEIEIDLGNPEPPEWNPEVKQRIKIMPKQETGAVGIRARTGSEKLEDLSNLELPKETPPPFRTEFKIRTKDRPSIEYWNFKPEPGQPLVIPLRYLVYLEEEAPKVEVNLFLPEGIELVNDQDYRITQEGDKTKVLLYSGPMRFKECKAFYLQVKPQRRELFHLKINVQLTNLKNEELLKEDKLDINLASMRY
ncbi:MAG: hypothetical protein ABIH18_05005 [Candidatus Omnitrophota bacterium]